MNAQLEAATKEARKGNSDIKKQVRHIGNVFSNCVEVGAQEAVYLALQIPLTKGTREVVYINTCASKERVFLLKPKSVLEELPAESTNIESDNIVQRYSKRPRQLQRFCLADYVSKVDVIYPKRNKLPETVEYRNDDSIGDENSSDENSEDEEMVQLLVFFCSSVPVVLFDTPGISRCRSQHVSVESSSLLHHSIYL